MATEVWEEQCRKIEFIYLTFYVYLNSINVFNVYVACSAAESI